MDSHLARVFYCLEGQAWDWDDVHFQFLYPSSDTLELGNDSSCVLKIAVGKDNPKSILLTGDIEKSAETYLVQHEKRNLSSTVLIAPHHGSKTSAEDSFIGAVHPSYVLFPVGYLNRYHFPHPTVLEKYKKANVLQYDTVTAGAIQFILSKDRLEKPKAYRLAAWHYWYDIS
jgi:competence protein ComEC